MAKTAQKTKITTKELRKWAAITILHFEDQGQDFLRWHIDEQGTVVKSEPFQNMIWKGARVTNFKTLKVGDKLDITHMSKNTCIKYPITKIEKP